MELSQGKNPGDSQFAHSPDTRSSLAALSLLAGGFAVVAALIYFLATTDERISAVVVASEDIGRLPSRNPDRNREGRVSGARGILGLKRNALVLERREDGARMLCDPAQKICGRLVQ